MTSGASPEPLDFFIWTPEDVGVWLDEIGLGSYKEIFKQNGVTGEYLDNLSSFTTEQILRFIRRCHMKWGDFITLCKELRNIKGMISQFKQGFDTSLHAYGESKRLGRHGGHHPVSRVFLPGLQSTAGNHESCH